MSTTVVSSFTATGVSATFANILTNRVDGRFNVSLWGTFVGTVQVERSFDNGTTWLPCTNLGATVTFTAPMSEVLAEPEADTLYRLRCTAYTSGTINYRIGQ